MRLIDASSLEKAIRRYWFRNPRWDQVPYGGLPDHIQHQVLDDAVQIDREENNQVILQLSQEDYDLLLSTVARAAESRLMQRDEAQTMLAFLDRLRSTDRGYTRTTTTSSPK